MEYLKTHHYVYKLTYHVIFCPKYRRKILKDGKDEYLKEILLEHAKFKNYEIIEMEVMPDHVHLLLSLPPELGILDAVKSIKRWTTGKMLSKFEDIEHKLPCLWTRSVFIATTGSVSLETVKQYIEDQKGK